MAWELLPVNYTDAMWSGLKKYNFINNEDNTVSLQDVTVYSHKENSFFGAKDANRMNEALNTIMSMVENGTDLYGAFQNYFNIQKEAFENEATTKQEGFVDYINGLKADGDAIIETIKTDYRDEISAFEDNQQAIFMVWFDAIKGQLARDPAGNLQNQIDKLDVKTDGFDARSTVFSADGKTITETFGNKKIVTEFLANGQIVQKLYVDTAMVRTKTITFSADGSNVQEEVK